MSSPEEQALEAPSVKIEKPNLRKNPPFSDLWEWASKDFPIFCKILIIEQIIFGLGWYAVSYLKPGFFKIPMGVDFINVYAAGLLVLQGMPELAYDWTVHYEIQQKVTGEGFPPLFWHYPPLFLAIAAVTALFPYILSFVLYLAASFAGYLKVFLRLAPQTKTGLLAMVAFPGVFINIMNGQNGFITAGLLGAGLLHLEKRPWLAGVFFGFLVYKPQFFVLIPALLLVGGYGKALTGTLASASIGLGLSFLVFGQKTWIAFFESTRLTQDIILEQGSTGWEKIQSLFSFVRHWNGSIPAAYTAQILVALAAIGCAAWVWRNKGSLATKASALTGAMLLTTPYVMDYDLVVLAVPIALLARRGEETGYRPYERALIALMWIFPLLARRTIGIHTGTLAPFLMIGLMAACLARSRFEKKVL